MASENAHIKGYRIIFTTPEALISALLSPLPMRPPEKAPTEAASKVRSRLQKYFVLKSKKVEGQSVVIVLEPNLPLLGPSFSEATQMELTFNLLNRGLGTYVYALGIKSQEISKISTTITVEPHPMGSLLTLELLSDGALTKGFVKVSENLGFLAATPHEAEIRARKENIAQ